MTDVTRSNYERYAHNKADFYKLFFNEQRTPEPRLRCLNPDGSEVIDLFFSPKAHSLKNRRRHHRILTTWIAGMDDATRVRPTNDSDNPNDKDLESWRAEISRRQQFKYLINQPINNQYYAS